MTRYAIVLLLFLGALLPSQAEAQVTFEPSKDNTIYEGDINNSNGAGISIFVGRIRGFVSPPARNRRGLIAFDLSSVPSGSKITSVELNLNLTATPGTPTVSLHRLLVDFGEGGASGSGDGETAQPPDATWINRITGSELQAWGAPGGQSGTDYVAAASASDTDGSIGSTSQLVADVQDWVDGVADNFGWIMIGNEATNGSVGRWSSSESGNPPELVVTFTSNDAIFSDGFESGNVNAWSASVP